MNPEFPKGLSNLACTVVRRDPLKAVPYVERAVALAPASPLYLANLLLITSHTLMMAKSGELALGAGQIQHLRQLNEQAQVRLSRLQPGYSPPVDCTWEFVPAG
jgi:hypothetical protein